MRHRALDRLKTQQTVEKNYNGEMARTESAGSAEQIPQTAEIASWLTGLVRTESNGGDSTHAERAKRSVSRVQTSLSSRFIVRWAPLIWKRSKRRKGGS